MQWPSRTVGENMKEEDCGTVASYFESKWQHFDLEAVGVFPPESKLL